VVAAGLAAVSEGPEAGGADEWGAGSGNGGGEETAREVEERDRG